MLKKISFIFKLIRIGLTSPSTFVKNINRRNLYTLKQALEDEEQGAIENNFKALVAPKDRPLLIEATKTYEIPIVKDAKDIGPEPEVNPVVVSASIDSDNNNNNNHKTSKKVEVNNVFQGKPKQKRQDSNEVKYLKGHTSKLQELETRVPNIPVKVDMGRKHIVIIGDLNLPQCKKYRVLQKVEILKKLNYECTFSHWQDIPRCLNVLQNATSVIFYRIPDSPITSCYLDEAIRLKIQVGYDIDDPIFDKAVYAANKNLNMITATEKASLLKSTDDYQSFIRKCNFIIVSTPGMMKVLSKHTNKPILLWRNLIDSETLNAYKYSQEVHFPSGKDVKEFVISYMSGSRAHEADFDEAKESIRKILKENESVKLRVMGYAKSGEELKKEFPKQVEVAPFTNYYAYLGGYQDINLNIIPLVCDEFNNCKSAIRMMEAALYEVPSMVSKTGDFINIIENKKDGILIKRSSDWYTQLSYYIKNKKALRAIGKKAKENVENNLKIDAFCNKFPKEIASYL